MNHYEDFAKFLRERKDILAKSFRETLLRRLDKALEYAYERGKEEGHAKGFAEGYHKGLEEGDQKVKDFTSRLSSR